MSPLPSSVSITLLRKLQKFPHRLAVVPILTVLIISAFGPRLSLPGGIDLALTLTEVSSKKFRHILHS